jgi:hypothetical protein
MTACITDTVVVTIALIGICNIDAIVELTDPWVHVGQGLF